MNIQLEEKRLMHKRVIIKKYIGDEANENGVIRAYDPASKKWWVINTHFLSAGDQTGWFAEDELVLIDKP